MIDTSVQVPDTSQQLETVLAFGLVYRANSFCHFTYTKISSKGLVHLMKASWVSHM